MVPTDILAALLSVKVKEVIAEVELHSPTILETKPPPLYPARGPPKVYHHFEDDFAQQHFEMNFDSFE